MLSAPLVSVIVPIYNVERYVSRCLESIQSQSYKHLEIICVDDCGNDKSMAIVEWFAREDSRFRLLFHDKNYGLGQARNTGTRAANGEYICYVDSDDWIEPLFIEEGVRLITTHGMDSVWFSAYLHDDALNGKAYKQIPLIKGQIYVDEASIAKLPCEAWAKIYKLQLIRDNKLEFSSGYYEDLSFFFKFCCISKKILQVDAPYYNYRQHKGSIMARTRAGAGNCKDMVRSFQESAKFLTEAGLFDSKKKLFIALYINHLEQFIYSKFYKKEALTFTQEALEAIGYPSLFEDARHPVLDCISTSKYKPGNSHYYKPLSAINKLNPIANLRKKWRVWLRVNMLYRD